MSDLSELIKRFERDYDQYLAECDVYDGASFTSHRIEFEAKFNAIIAEQTKKAFRDGQLDCQKAGDPTNHVHFKEAVAEQNRLAKLSVWREILGEDFDKFFPEDKFNDFIKVPSFFITAALKLNNGGGDE